MKYILITIVGIFIRSAIATDRFGQIKNCSGQYVYKGRYYDESIILRPNGTFLYQNANEFAQSTVSGNWQARGDTVVLDSHPQRDRLLVFESYQKKLKCKIVYVCNKLKEPINYRIVYVTTSNDTVSLADQWKLSKIDIETKSFYLVDTNGLTSPSYIIQGTSSNVFDVLFETQRVFESESWILDGNKIIPRGQSGKLQPYELEKMTQ